MKENGEDTDVRKTNWLILFLDIYNLFDIISWYWTGSKYIIFFFEIEEDLFTTDTDLRGPKAERRALTNWLGLEI